MSLQQPLKQILAATQKLWDQPETRASVLSYFKKVLNCRTAALGAEVFASDTEEKLAYHTCKSRACPRCGYRATVCGNGSNGLISRIFPIGESLLPCLRSCGQFLSRTAICFTICQHWERQRYSNGRKTNVECACSLWWCSTHLAGT